MKEYDYEVTIKIGLWATDLEELCENLRGVIGEVQKFPHKLKIEEVGEIL